MRMSYSIYIYSQPQIFFRRRHSLPRARSPHLFRGASPSIHPSVALYAPNPDLPVPRTADARTRHSTSQSHPWILASPCHAIPLLLLLLTALPAAIKARPPPPQLATLTLIQPTHPSPSSRLFLPSHIHPILSDPIRSSPTPWLTMSSPATSPTVPDADRHTNTPVTQAAPTAAVSQPLPHSSAQHQHCHDDNNAYTTPHQQPHYPYASSSYPHAHHHPFYYNTAAAAAPAVAAGGATVPDGVGGAHHHNMAYPHYAAHLPQQHYAAAHAAYVHHAPSPYPHPHPHSHHPYHHQAHMMQTSPYASSAVAAMGMHQHHQHQHQKGYDAGKRVAALGSATKSSGLFWVREDRAGAIIGKQGAVIKELQTKSRTDIQVHNDVVRNGHKLVTVLGYPKQINVAVRLIARTVR